MDKQKYVLITGAGGGIGFELTKLLAESGFFVIAGIHNLHSLEALKNLGKKNILPIKLDVTNQDEIKEQFKTIDYLLAENGLYGLINNAGIAIPGPIEYTLPEQFNQQLQVNVVGALTMTQASLPYLRKAQGKIISIGSISGRLTGPLLGTYSASKFALRALSQSMLLELKPWNIAVTYIEAGNINTPIWQKGIDFIQSIERNDSLLSAHYDKQLKVLIELSQQMAKTANSPRAITRVILKCLMANKLKPLYLVGKDAKILYCLDKVLPPNIISNIINFILNRRVQKYG